MAMRLRSKAALVSVSALALCVPAFVSPHPDSCAWTAGLAGAAPTPSPSCGGDLRECLRAAADMHPTTFGVRYVTAEDVARCMEIFDACIHGGASSGRDPALSTPTSTGDDRAGLPQRFRISFDTTTIDCRVNGDDASCTQTREESLPSGGHYSLSGEITGTVSGMTLTGSFKDHSTSSGHSSGCVSEQDHSGPVRYEFRRDGSVAMRWGPAHVDTVFTGACSNAPPTSESYPVWEGTGTWSPTE